MDQTDDDDKDQASSNENDMLIKKIKKYLSSGHPQGLYNYIYSFECTVSHVDFA